MEINLHAQGTNPLTTRRILYAKVQRYYNTCPNPSTPY